MEETRDRGGAAVSRKAKSSAFDDVFGGPPRFVAPFAARMDDYTEVFGGIAGSCSIPFLDLPPAVDGAPIGDRNAAAFDYSEVFGGLNFGDFAVSYEELVSDGKREEKFSSNERAPKEATVSHQAEEASEIQQGQLGGSSLVYPEDDRVSSNSLNLDSSPDQFNLKYSNSTTRMRESALSGRKHLAQHSGSKVNSIDASNILHTRKSDDPHGAVTEMINDKKLEDKFSPTSSSDASRSLVSDVGADKKEATNQYPSPQNDNANIFHHSRSSSSHSVSSGDAASSDVMYVSVSDISLRTQPLRVPPPSRPPPKIFNKQVHPTVKMRVNPKVGLDQVVPSKPILNHEKNFASFTSQSHADKEVLKDNFDFFDIEVDAKSAAAASAAAMKEAMEQAEATLKSAKELMEKQRDNFHVRKKMGHDEDTKHKERKMDQSSKQAERFNEKLFEETMLKEANQFNAIALKEIDKVKNAVKAKPDGQQMETKATLKEGDGNMTNGIVSKEANSVIDNTTANCQQMETKAILNEKDGSSVKAKPDCQQMDTKANLKKEDGNIINGTVWKEEMTGKDNAEPDCQQMETKAISNEEDGNIINGIASNERKTVKDAARAYAGVEERKSYAVLAEEDEKTMLGGALESSQPASGLEENPGKWKANKEYYELSNEKKCKKIAETSQQESFRNKNKAAADVSEKNQNGYKEAAAASEFKSDTQLMDNNERIKEEESFTRLKDGNISSEEEEIKVIPDVPEARVYAHVFVPEKYNSAHEREQEKPEAAQMMHDEEVKAPYADDSASGRTEKELESLDNYIFQENHDSKEGKVDSMDVKQPCESEGKSYIYEEICDNENEQVKSGTAENAYKCEINESKLGVADLTCEPSESEEKLSVVMEIPTLEEMETNLPDESCTFEGKDEREASYECNGSEKFERESIKRDHIDNLNKMGETGLSHFQEEGEKLPMKQESRALAENEFRLNTDQGDDLEEIFKKIKAAQETVASVEQVHKEEKLMKATEIAGKESSSEDREQKKLMGVAKAVGEEDCSENKAQVECQESNKKQEAAQASSMLRSSEEKKDEHEIIEDANLKGSQLQSGLSDTTKEGHHEVPSMKQDEQQVNLHERKGNVSNSAQDARENYLAVSQMEEKEKEKRMDKERQLAAEQARKLEEENEREREREKDRIAVERATREAHERALAEAKERATRIAVERVTAEARQRALKEAREKAERASAESLEKSLAEKAAREARLRAERAAVERATAEARERAAERARAGKAAADARDRAERSNAYFRDRMRKENVAEERVKAGTKDGMHGAPYQMSATSSNYQGDGESELRHKARLERHQRTAERAAKALAEKNKRDILAQREQAERDRLADYLDADIKRWSTGKEGNLRALLSTLQYILGPDSGWQPIPLTEVITAAAVKKAYRKATLCVHPDKLQQRGASIQQKYICEKVFDLLKEAWNRFNSEER